MKGYSTITMFSRHRILSLILLIVTMLFGCASEQQEVVDVEQPVVIEDDGHIELTFASQPSNSNAMTRLADNIVQSGTTYRNIIGFNIFALNDGVPYNAEIDIYEYSGLKTDNTKFYHFDYCFMPRGTNGCLVYAKAEDVPQAADDYLTAGQRTMIYNGSLNAVISNDVTSTDDIHFEPVPIYDDVSMVPAEATALGNALTSVVNAVPSWPASKNAILQNLYGNFTNRGYDIPGSAASVKQWMLSLSDAANAYLTMENRPTSLGEDEMDILGDIKTAATTAAAAITVNATSYPRNINLPDGAAALRWTEVEEDGWPINKFVPQLQATTLDNINTVTRFVYPPALYYFVDSELRTSNEKVDYNGDNGYKNDASWSDVLTRFTDGGTVTSGTKAVAVADPLQYAVAQLQVKVKANAVNLKYTEDAGATIAINAVNEGVTSNYFRLTGVIVGGQRPVDYQFQQASNLDSDVKFVFDSQVPNDFYLTTTEFNNENAQTFNTLVLESYGGKVTDDAEDVKIILEFEYTGPQAFKCQNGYVYPNTRFYLVGEVKALKGDDVNEDLDYTKRVFTKDYTTMVQMTVKSLEKAYNVLPSILSKNLEIGVETTPKWIFATPPDPVILDDED